MMASTLGFSPATSLPTRRFGPLLTPTSVTPNRGFHRTKSSGRPLTAGSRTIVAQSTPAERPPPSCNGNYITVLSIDGGGVRGIIPGTILQSLEAQLQAIDGPGARVADYFDVIAGTSTGGLVTAMITAPDANRRPFYAAKDIVDFYLEQCPKIFPQTGLLGTLGSLFSGAKYDGVYLHKLVKDLLPTANLSDVLTDVVIPAFDIKYEQPVVFSSFEAKAKPSKNPLLADVCISTSAAPTFLPPYYFENKNGGKKPKTYDLIDGGVAANNPTMAAISLIARELMNKDNEDYPINRFNPLGLKKFLVLSLGTGSAKQEERFSAPEADKWGTISWIFQLNGSSPIIDVYSQAQSDMVDFHATVFFQSVDGVDNYIRMQDDSLTGTAASVDNSSKENLDNLVQIGRNLLKKPLSRINIDTGLPEPVPGAGTNEEALAKLADTLSKERKNRLKSLSI